MKKGVQLYTVREHMSSKEELLDSLQKIKAIGYDSVQGWAPGFISVAEYKAMCDEVGLENCSSSGSYEEMLADPAAIRKAVADARILGVTDIAIGTLPEDQRESEEGYHRFAAGINRIAAEVKKEGMRLLYHAHALEFFSLGGGRKGMDIIVEETDPQGMHFCMDTHWLACGGVNVVDWIYKARGRMHIVHFKDYAIVGGVQLIEGVAKRFAEVGEGNIDWSKVVAACKEIGVEFAIVEQDSCPGNPFDSLRISFDNMVKFGV